MREIGACATARTAARRIWSGVAPALLLSPVALAAQAGRPPVVELRAGMVITTSVRVSPRAYRLTGSASFDSAVITVRGSDITVDFAGATLQGSDPRAAPDRAAGVAIRIDGGHDVRILNARVHGYKVGILARGTRRLTIARSDLGDNWRPRLYSQVEHESLVDWLDFHHNDHGEWLRYGAAIYLDGVHGGEIHDTRAEHGMNGLMLVGTDSVRIWNNDFSYDSGVGLGLYRSNDNVILHNRLDYDVRGYSAGFYRRGQDSAGLLIYEQSTGNVVAYNSITHGGDGLFLWAGQQTMDSGAGGVNDNLFYANDFSFAPANCMEATFSRNAFVANRLEGCEYGLWGGYSYDSRVERNRFIRNRTGIGIEHGQHDIIASNTFTADSTAISLWANPIEPSDWGYPKHRDTRSRDYRIEGNTLGGNRAGLRLANTIGIDTAGNRFEGVDSAVVRADTSSRATGDAVAGPTEGDTTAIRAPAPLPGGVMPATAPLETRPRASIVVDEWGPYDWRSPKLWPVDSTHAVPLRLRVLGPAGTWRVVSRRGIASLSRTAGRTLDTIAVTPAPNGATGWTLVLRFQDARPRTRPVRFAFGRFEPAVDWTTRLFAWSDSTDPRAHPDAFDALLRTTPLHTAHVARLDYEGYGRLMPAWPADHVAISATGTVDLPPGTYVLRTISDDALRVWIDDTLAIDDWAPHESAVDSVALGGGRHRLRAVYYQVDAWAELRLDIVRASETPRPN